MINWKTKSVLVTGSCGTVGKALISKLLKLKTKKIIAFDNSERDIAYLSESFSHKSIQFILGDIRVYESISNAVSMSDIIFHGAALKHVFLGEEWPDEIIQTNIIGVQNLIKAAKKNSTEKVIFMSSDKAVNPTNVMGTSKLLAEKLFSAAHKINSKTIFSTTRFGNVLGSSGSVLPIILNQIDQKKNVTLTDKEMTRFIMSSSQAVELLISAAEEAKGGEVFVTKMPSVKISDLINVTIELYLSKKSLTQKVLVKTIGKKVGEKLFEELICPSESKRVYETKDFYIIFSALLNSKKISIKNLSSYRSDKVKLLSKKDLVKFYKRENILNNVER